jgi:hypothetical protein
VEAVLKKGRSRCLRKRRLRRIGWRNRKRREKRNEMLRIIRWRGRRKEKGGDKFQENKLEGQEEKKKVKLSL